MTPQEDFAHSVFPHSPTCSKCSKATCRVCKLRSQRDYVLSTTNSCVPIDPHIPCNASPCICAFVCLHSECNKLFVGYSPEPLQRYLSKLRLSLEGYCPVLFTVTLSRFIDRWMYSSDCTCWRSFLRLSALPRSRCIVGLIDWAPGNP